MADRYLHATSLAATQDARRTISIDVGIGICTGDVRVVWNDSYAKDEVLESFLALEEALAARIRAEGACAADT